MFLIRGGGFRTRNWSDHSPSCAIKENAGAATGKQSQEVFIPRIQAPNDGFRNGFTCFHVGWCSGKIEDMDASSIWDLSKVVSEIFRYHDCEYSDSGHYDQNWGGSSEPNDALVPRDFRNLDWHLIIFDWRFDHRKTQLLMADFRNALKGIDLPLFVHSLFSMGRSIRSSVDDPQFSREFGVLRRVNKYKQLK